ncbi:MAG: OmpA family protein [Flavobacteriaceae bacterium]|nr:OmpA family protein [Flavobacteriaceae bacterium]
MKLKYHLFILLFLASGYIEAQTKRLKRPSSRVGIASVDRFVSESFNLYNKVYRYDGYHEQGKPLEDDDYEILIDAVEDAEGVLATAPDAVSDLDGAGVLKQGKGTLQMNRAKKALKYSIKTAKKLLTERPKQKDDTSSDDSSDTSSAGGDNQGSRSTSNTGSSDQGAETPSNVSDNLEVYSKFDFVPGDKLLFFDDFSNDFIGDFPSKWNTNGGGELVTLGDSQEKWLELISGYGVYFIPDTPTLPEEYTIEFDLMTVGLDRRTSSTAKLRIDLSDDDKFKEGDNFVQAHLPFCQYSAIGITMENRINRKREIYSTVKADLREEVLNRPHISIAVNKQRFRLWVNQEKHIDIPRIAPQGALLNTLKFNLNGFADGKERIFITNLKVAEGGVDLRRQLINNGKFSTNGILFDSGSANIQPQSYGIIRQISQALQQVPDMKLNIIGHTDSDGSDEANMTLSKKRADAVRNALVTVYNISGDRLQTEGKGESDPVGDNTTADGKAQNRRVVFIKI